MYSTIFLSILILTSISTTPPPTISYQTYFPHDKSPLPACGLYLTDPTILGLNYGRAMVPLKNIAYTLEVVNSLAHITLKQQYENPSDKFLNVYFSFPINPKSAIYKMVAEFGSKVIQGVVKQKEQARKEFEEAKNTGKQAVLTEIDANSRDIIRMNIGNIPPETKVTITIAFVQEMVLSVSTFYRIQVPSTISPRYMNSAPMSQVKIDQLEQPLLTDINTRISKVPGFTWSFRIILKTYRRIAYYNSTTHKLKEISSKNKKEVQITLLEDTVPDKDFVFLYTTQDFEKPSYVIGEDQNSSTVQVSFIPKFSNLKDLEEAYKYARQEKNQQFDLQSVKGEFIFILDRSGSMDSASRIGKAKQALIIFLRSLPSNSYFNIISFGSSFTSMFNKSERYENSKIKSAIQEISRMGADYGGTEIYQPLDFALSQERVDGYPRFVFLLTDGQVSNTQSVIRMAKKKSKNSRINSIGIGNGASEALIQGAAEAGRGKHVMITDVEDPSEKIINLLNSALTPLITKFTLKYDKQLIESVIPNPQKIPYILKDDPANFYMIFKNKLQQSTKVTLQYEDSVTNKIYSQEIKIQPKRQSYRFVDKMARFKVLRALENLADNQENSLMDYLIYNKFSKKNTLKKEAELYSVEHQILSQYTSFIAVVKELSDQEKKIYREIGSSSILVAQPIAQEYKSESYMALMRAFAGMSSGGATLASSFGQSIRSAPSLFSGPPAPPPVPALIARPTAKNIQTSGGILNSLPDDSSKLRTQTLDKKSENSALNIKDFLDAQNADGSWNDDALTSKILAQCKCQPKFDLQKLKLTIRKDVLNTKLALAWIQKMKLGQQYSLIIKKSQQWLKKAIAKESIDEKTINTIQFD